MINTIRQFKFFPIATVRASLRSICRINLDTQRTGTFCLVSQAIKEHPPCSISNRFVDTFKIIVLHIINGQIFNNNSIKFIHELTGKLMCKIMSLIFYSFMYSCYYFFGLVSFWSIFSLLREPILCFSKYSFFLLKKPGVWILLPIGQYSKLLQSHINPNGGFNRTWNRSMFNIARQVYKPFAGRHSFDGTSFNYALNRAMKFNFYIPYFRKMNNILIKFKTSLGISKRIVPFSPPKSWVTRFCVGFNSTVKGTKGKINSRANILLNLAVNITQKWVFFLEMLKCITLVISRKTFLFKFPRILALFKKMIVQPTTITKSLIEDCSLFVCWENPVLKSFSHCIYTITLICIMSRANLKYLKI